MEEWEAKLVERIKYAMAARGQTQTTLGKAIGMQQRSISDRMTGIVSWNAREIPAVARALGVPIEELLPRLDSNQQPAGYRYALRRQSA